MDGERNEQAARILGWEYRYRPRTCAEDDPGGDMWFAPRWRGAACYDRLPDLSKDAGLILRLAQANCLYPEYWQEDDSEPQCDRVMVVQDTYLGPVWFPRTGPIEWHATIGEAVIAWIVAAVGSGVEVRH